MKAVTKHRRGDLVRNRANKWYGRVLRVSCGMCDKSYRAGRPTCKHTRFPLALLTIHQLRVGGDLRPWCRVEDFPIVKVTR